ncbi:MAG: chemotaxis protein CheC [Patescibacteria group bacterium]|nr:chemotaxis protein CheC [Patescibacteria group bacterium]
MVYRNDDLQQLNSLLDSYLTAKTIPSLGLILEEPIEYSLKQTKAITLANLDLLVSSSQKMNVMSAVYVKCTGDLHIGVLWYVLEEELKPLATKLLGASHSNEVDKFAASSISEIGNILTASIANAMYDDIGCKIWSSVPGYAIESLEILLESVASDLGEHTDTLVISAVEFRGAHSGIKLQMLLIQDPKEVKKLVV